MLSHNVPLSRALESRWDFLRKLLRSRRKYALNCSLNVAPNDVISVSLKEKRARGTEEELNHLRFYCASFGLVIRCSPPQRNVINAIKKRKYLCKTTFLGRVIKNSNCHSVIDEACRCQVATACAFRQKLFASFFIIIAIQRGGQAGGGKAHNIASNWKRENLRGRQVNVIHCGGGRDSRVWWKLLCQLCVVVRLCGRRFEHKKLFRGDTKKLVINISRRGKVSMLWHRSSHISPARVKAHGENKFLYLDRPTAIKIANKGTEASEPFQLTRNNAGSRKNLK